MGPSTPPDLIARCASFFLSNQQYEKAAQLYITGRRYADALAVCIDHRLAISDEMAEALTPPKASSTAAAAADDNDDDAAAAGNDTAGVSRTSLLRKLGKYLASTGSFHMATKKFTQVRAGSRVVVRVVDGRRRASTQAGDKLSAMKCLIKSNDTSKIIYYATMTKRREIYMLAANYLQNVDWHADPEITKTIIAFYTKANAFDSLATFYDSCAQVEIDDYRDYEKVRGSARAGDDHRVVTRRVRRCRRCTSAWPACRGAPAIPATCRGGCTSCSCSSKPGRSWARGSKRTPSSCARACSSRTTSR